MVSCLCEFNPVISIDHFGCGDQEGEKDRLMNSDRISKEFQLDGKRKGSMLADYVFCDQFFTTATKNKQDSDMMAQIPSQLGKTLFVLCQQLHRWPWLLKSGHPKIMIKENPLHRLQGPPA